MNEPDEKLLNRIKNDEYRKRGWDSYHNPYKECSDFTNEVCRRYAESYIDLYERAMSKIAEQVKEIDTRDNEISQLKKQLEEAEKGLDHWKNAYHNSTDRERAQVILIEELEDNNFQLKSKLSFFQFFISFGYGCIAF